MREKLSLEEFLLKIKQLKELVIQAEELNTNDEIATKNFFDQYVTALQSDLLSYDLSDIPFVAWKGFEIYCDEEHIVDFSGTNANIDFGLVDCEGNCNFSGCNVKNLGFLTKYLNPKMFDEETIKANADLFLSDVFFPDFKEKFYNCTLTISDLASLSSEQIEEFKQKVNWYNYNDFKESALIRYIGLEKAIQLYKNSPNEYGDVCTMVDIIGRLTDGEVLTIRTNDNDENIIKLVSDVEVSQLKKTCFEFMKNQFINSRNIIDRFHFPDSFISENPDLFLDGVNIPDEVKTRYFYRKLKIEDVINYSDAFQKFPIDNFIAAPVPLYYEYWTDFHKFIMENYGMGKFQELIVKHPLLFKHFEQEDDFYLFKSCFKTKSELETDFRNAIKEYVLLVNPSKYVTTIDGNRKYEIPEWLAPMKFKFIDKLETIEDLLQLQYDDSTIVFDIYQNRALTMIGLDNLKRFDKETGFFSMMDQFKLMIEGVGLSLGSYFLEKSDIDFKNGTLSYNEFINEFVKLLDLMRANNIFTDLPNYDFIKGDFRNKHPEIFIDVNAPEELKAAFYSNAISIKFLCEHKEYFSYLLDKNLRNVIKNLQLAIPGETSTDKKLNFVDEYASRYGNEKLLQIITKYGPILSEISMIGSNGVMDSEQVIEEKVKEAIYARICDNEGPKVEFSYLSNVLANDYPKLFVNFDSLTSISKEERQRLTEAFYHKSLHFEDVRKYPELIPILKEKNLFVAFGRMDGEHRGDNILFEGSSSDLELLKVFGNEKFLQLCAKHGSYMEHIGELLRKELTIIDGKYVDSISLEKNYEFEEISTMIEKIIVRECKLGNILYYPGSAPDYLKENKELFLSGDAPEELKKVYYGHPKSSMSFNLLKENKNEWLPFLSDKLLFAPLVRGRAYPKEEITAFFDDFGVETAMKLGLTRTETVEHMLRTSQISLMKSWYDKTGGKFVPDFVVMQNFKIEEADKFLTFGSNWSTLMKIKSFAKEPDYRDVMLKLAYSFGVFDGDKYGFKKVQELLTHLPRTIDADKGYILERIDDHIDIYSKRNVFYHSQKTKNIDDPLQNVLPNMTNEEKEEAYKKMVEFAKTTGISDIIDENNLVDLLESLKKENVEIDFSKPIFTQLYKQNEDGSYILTINPQSYPKTSKSIRSFLEKFNDLSILTPKTAHQYMGDFKLEYDADFREFFLNNFNEIISKTEALSQISAIQKRFKEIKSLYSNVPLTLELALSYINDNKYVNVNDGNDRVTQVAATQGYSQDDFEMLQKIYNYGKQRTFSSIPRIESKNVIELPTGNYHYEILRLDDPRAMSIGFESDCCQRLGSTAELCMEHSMVDKNGRVFVVTNEKGELVAQSWVWRNKNVLCFDNIEVPDRKMWDNGVPRGQEDSGIQNQFTDDILKIYKMAAKHLMVEDEKIYKELLESGKITKEQYEGLRLGKITAGEGYSNIKGSLRDEKLVSIDKSVRLSRPLNFVAPVDLTYSLYTSDSATTQYILEERDDRKEYDGATLSVHSDTFTEFTDYNLDKKDLLTLTKLELVTKGYKDNIDFDINEEVENSVTKIAGNCGLNPEKTKIVMNPNFAIVYETDGDKVKVGDLLFNTKVDNEEQQMDISGTVTMQIRMALEQIGKGKQIDVVSLVENQKEMYDKAMGLADEIDNERGVSHGRK